MPARSWLRGASYAFAAVVFIAAILYAFLASGLTNAALKARLESRLSLWSGLNVQSSGDVGLNFFPPRATLTSVKAASAQPAISAVAESLTISFSLFSLIADNPVVNEVKISGGNVEIVGSQAFRDGKNHGALSAPGTIRLDSTKLTILWPGGRKDTVDELTGTLKWAALGDSAKISALGNWQGESAGFEGSIDSPLNALSGGQSSVTVQLKSAPLSFDFAGNLSYPGNLLAEGQLTASTPSLNAVLEWLKVPAQLAGNHGSLDMEASLSHADGKFTLNELAMSFGGIPATGTLVLDPSPQTPLVSGTLAFEKADLGSLVAAFQPGALDETYRNLDLDLRFSAETVQAASLVLENAAGTIKVSGNDTFLDLGSGRFAGGECVGSLKFSGPASKREAVAKLSMRDVTADQIAPFDGSLPLLAAPLSAQFEAQGEFKDWTQFVRQAQGNLKISIGEGVARNFSTDMLATQVSGGTAFPLAEVYAGLTPVASGEINGFLARGAAIISSADVQFASHKLRLSGAIPLLSRGVALNGHIIPAGEEASGLPFFIGGTWSRPFVTMGATK